MIYAIWLFFYLSYDYSSEHFYYSSFNRRYSSTFYFTAGKGGTDFALPRY
jgi:hypothetical protein